MSLRRLAAALVAVMVTATPAARTQETPAKGIENAKKFPPTEKNASAEELEQLALLLGIDAHGNDAPAEHPSREDVDAYRQATFGSWLDSQLRIPDESIASPPVELKSFLDKRRSVVGRVTALLGREVPEWGGDARDSANRIPPTVLAASLEKILLSAALVEERAGDHGGAASLLEASWSLYSSPASRPDLISQIVSVAIGKMLAGVLRKMSEAPVQWLDRMSGDSPRRGMFEALEGHGHVRAWRAVADHIQRLSPCEIAGLNDEQIWKLSDEEFEKWKGLGGDSSLQDVMEASKPNLTAAIRRVGRNLVDRELTAKVLELRLEKAASRDGRWPEKFFDTESRACPGSAYAYQARGVAMSIRFTGSIDEPATPGTLSLPLVFEVRPPPPPPTPTRPPRPPPRPKATPAPALDTRG